MANFYVPDGNKMLFTQHDEYGDCQNWIRRLTAVAFPDPFPLTF